MTFVYCFGVVLTGMRSVGASYSQKMSLVHYNERILLGSTFREIVGS